MIRFWIAALTVCTLALAAEPYVKTDYLIPRLRVLLQPYPDAGNELIQGQIVPTAFDPLFGSTHNILKLSQPGLQEGRTIRGTRRAKPVSLSFPFETSHFQRRHERKEPLPQVKDP